MLPAADLEALVDARLRELPPPRAPRTLLPRVLLSVQAWSRRPWYSRAWFTWPVWGQVASMASFVLLVAACVMLLPSAWTGLTEAAGVRSSAMTSDLAAVLSRIEAVIDSAHVVWRTLLQPVATVAFVLATMMWLACVALGTALIRVVLREVVPQ